MVITDVLFGKSDRSVPVALVKYGDRDTTAIRIVIDRYSADIDLSVLGWAIKLSNGENTDIVPFTPEVKDSTLEYSFTLPAIVASAPGICEIELEGVNAELNMVWQSGTRTIKVIDDLDAEPGYDPDELSIFQQTIMETTIHLNDINNQMDGFEGRISEAVSNAEEATADATTAAERAEDAVTRAETALDNSDKIVAAAEKATESATSAATEATSAAESARTATDSANTAANKAQSIADTVERKLAAGELTGPQGERGLTGKTGAQGEPGQSIYHQWQGTTLVLTSASGTNRVNLQGPKGDPGESITGPAGSDANVTAENVKKALGYTPADAEDVVTKEDLLRVKTGVEGKADKSDIDRLDDTVKAVFPAVKTVGHRGGDDTVAPQCTAAAQVAAYRRGIKYIENDPQLSADGKVVMWHDSNFSRLGNTLVDVNGYPIYVDASGEQYYLKAGAVYTYTDDYIPSSVPIASLTPMAGSSYKCNNRTVAQLKRISFGHWFGEEFTNQTVMTFGEWMWLSKSLGQECVVDGVIGKNEVEAMAKIAKQYGMGACVDFNTTDHYVPYVRAICPNAKFHFMGALTESNIAKYSALNKPESEVYCNVSARTLTIEEAQAVINAGMRIEAWYVDFGNESAETTFEVFRRIVSYGVSGICTDHYRVEEAFRYLADDISPDIPAEPILPNQPIVLDVTFCDIDAVPTYLAGTNAGVSKVVLTAESTNPKTYAMGYSTAPTGSYKAVNSANMSNPADGSKNIYAVQLPDGAKTLDIMGIPATAQANFYWTDNTAAGADGSLAVIAVDTTFNWDNAVPAGDRIGIEIPDGANSFYVTLRSRDRTLTDAQIAGITVTVAK